MKPAAPLASAPDQEAMPEIKGFLETSFVDWPGRVCAMLFLGGCNFRCPFCHNHPLVTAPQRITSIPFGKVSRSLSAFRNWLKGVCISGGEPTLSPALPGLLTRLKEEGWPVKLDTNGTRPEVLEALIADGLVDMIAMDVKAPLIAEKYERCAGVPVDLARIRASIDLLRQSGIDHEFRMTVLPGLHSEEDVRLWSKTLGPRSKRKLQNFSPKSTLKPDFASAKGFSPASFTRLQSMIA